MTLFVAVEHGECEIILCKFISLWLRTDVVPISRANGSETISLRESGEYLCQGPFKDLKSLNKYYRDYKKGRAAKNLKMEDVTIFVIMDVDGDRLSAKSFRSRDLFKDSPFYDRIVPIMNDPNLDHILRSAGYDIDGRKKPDSYRRVLGEVKSIQDFCESLKGLDTDLPVMIDAI